MGSARWTAVILLKDYKSSADAVWPKAFVTVSRPNLKGVLAGSSAGALLVPFVACMLYSAMACYRYTRGALLRDSAPLRKVCVMSWTCTMSNAGFLCALFDMSVFAKSHHCFSTQPSSAAHLADVQQARQAHDSNICTAKQSD